MSKLAAHAMMRLPERPQRSRPMGDVMPRYDTHLVDGDDRLSDPDGTILSADAVARHTLHSAEDIISSDAHQGKIDLKYRLEVHDEAGHVVHERALIEVVEIVRN